MKNEDLLHHWQEAEFEGKQKPKKLSFEDQIIRNIRYNPKSIFDAIEKLISHIDSGDEDALNYYLFFVSLAESALQWKECIRTFAVYEADKYPKDQLKDMGWEFGKSVSYAYPNNKDIELLKAQIKIIQDGLKASGQCETKTTIFLKRVKTK